jgi:UDP-N-acetylmuramate dehydrogenase
VRIADEAGDPMLLVAGGSNLVVADEGVDATVIRVLTQGVVVDMDACSGAQITVQAGETWDAIVARAVDEEWIGVEALSGIPGSVGATPIQNVGAYGQEVAQTIASVRVYDRFDRAIRTIAVADCGFTYRSSRFKVQPHRFVVLTVTFQLPLGDLGAPIAYGELARALGVDLGERAPAAGFARPCSSCAGARAWCSTPTTTTPGAQARSSPTPSSRPTRPMPCQPTHRAGSSPTGPSRRAPPG